MRIPLFAFAASLLLAAQGAAAHRAEWGRCTFESDFDLRIAPDALTFSRDAGTPASVVMARGGLRVDGREVALSPADRARLRDLERDVRRLVPDVKALAVDAVALAADAVIEVAAGISGDRRGGASAARVRRIGDRLVARIERADDTREFDDAVFEREIAAMTAEVVPALVADVTAQAISIALSGDAAAARDLERRAQRLEREIEDAVAQRAKSLEARADALCPRLKALDALEAELELRVAGAALDLLQVR